jgi:iron(III) transport system permease protein
MTLGVYPLVYLPVAASLRSADPSLEESARSLGLGRTSTFVRVTLPQIRGALAGGGVLVALVILAEYGAFEQLRFQTFTTEIFAELSNFSIPNACAMALVLVLVGVVVLGAEFGARGRQHVARVGQGAPRARRPHELGRWRVPVLLGVLGLVAAALFLPISACIYWIVTGPPATLAGASLLNAGWHTAYYSALAAALTTVLALPVALLALRHDSVVARLLDRVSYLVLAVPGVVVALALGYFSIHYLGGAEYQSTGMLVVAYAILFFPLALVAVKASVAHAPPRLEEAARSLGARHVTVLVRVTLPLIGPGLAAAFCLVFLAGATELTATLLLIPLGAQTLSTEFWFMETNLSYGQAAPFALVMIAVAALPSYVLARFFDRLPSRTPRVA